MARPFTEPKLVVASHNKGKLMEIADLLTRFEVVTVGAAAQCTGPRPRLFPPGSAAIDPCVPFRGGWISNLSSRLQTEVFRREVLACQK